MAWGTHRQRSESRWTMQRWALVAILAVVPGQGWRRGVRAVVVFVTLNFRVVGRKHDMAMPVLPGYPTWRYGWLWSKELNLMWFPCSLLWKATAV